MNFTLRKGLALLGLASAVAASCTVETDYEITFYGYPDNDPASAETAYNCGGRDYIAGGTGTYDDPLTFATAPGEFEKCEIIYLPYLRKYLRLEDVCEQCTTDYKEGKHHIDVWTGSSTVNGGETQIRCEDALTPSASQSVIVNPASTYTVNAAALFSDDTCHTSDTYSNADASSYCSSSGSSSSICSWAGHCAGASCENENDCSGSLTCVSGKCA
ncbi:hypothetical protein BO70DRAFT_415772 [Aspergillus heteromorphus CBS 117.55]|uniref:Chitin-binding type-4 domain-containing protein n=1 Tax=Aspergillus heteromorphus CBS 117.55 TaxID=1448321 RepID=A0A317WVU4_9EURO|nr:uncharacterized protein BO70DRAFT_415772 [Aspergillus heteromorphus CBS 117.55]PWY90215.1 hypothetical protein BO70DRAFT_415772 [Aspergillus heteromorphus CBS 117.55]